MLLIKYLKISTYGHKLLAIQTFDNLSLPAEGDAEVTADGVHQRGFPLMRRLTLNNKKPDLVYPLGLQGGPTK